MVVIDNGGAVANAGCVAVITGDVEGNSGSGGLVTMVLWVGGGSLLMSQCFSVMVVACCWPPFA